MSLYLITCKYSISSIRHARSSFSPDMPLSSCILSNLLFLGDLSPTVSSPPDPAGQYGSPVQFSSVQSCLTLCDPMNSSMPGFPVHNQLLELAQTHVHRISDTMKPSHPLSSPYSPVSIFPSMRVFSNGSVLGIRWPKYWSHSFSISPSNEYSELISFRMDWLDLLAVQGTLKSLLQHHNSKAPILLHSAFFLVQLSNPYMTTGKTIALTRQTLLAK